MASNSVSQERPLPQVTFFSVEYPGYVQEASVPSAIQKLGGQSRLDNAFRRSAQRKDALLELSFRSNDPFAHPIPGDIVPANNLLLKIIKRKRRLCTSAGSSKDGAIGEFTAEITGIVSKTARFRSASLVSTSFVSLLKWTQVWPTISTFLN
jgi:general transcription factor 3C polypeptide 5 (transcription factor C subunit 1)